MSYNNDPIRTAFGEAHAILDAFLSDNECMKGMQRFTDRAVAVLTGGNKIMTCGNGGSMCDAMHFAEELTGRFRKDREALPAMAFSDPSHLTCIANDFGFDEVFARSLTAFAKPGDLLIAISTSGNSPNILRALEVAKIKGVQSIGLLGQGGGKARELCDIPIVVPLATTSDRIQEMHIKIIHIVIEAVERRMYPANYPKPERV